MSEIDGLLQQKNDLLEQIRRIEESCDDNKILNAIRNQRWFYFQDKPKVIFDRNTAILWVDLNHAWYSSGWREPSKILALLNDSINLDGYTDWEIPTLFEFWNLVKAEDFPYRDSNGRIKNETTWPVYHDGALGSTDLYCLERGESYFNRDRGAPNLLPCCHTLVPKVYDYEDYVSPSNNLYSEKEKLQFTLNIFVSNELIPMFKDESITQLYRQIYIERPTLLKQLSDVQSEINKLQATAAISSTFDYDSLINDYDVEAIEKSIIKYAAAVQSLANAYLEKLEYYEEVKQNIINEYNALISQLNDAQLKKRLEFNMVNLQAAIISFETQAEAIENQIDELPFDSDLFIRLAEIESKPHASFNLIAEYLGNLVKNALLKIEFYEAHSDFVKYVVEAWKSWNNSYNDAADKLKDNSEWQRRRYTIEQRFVPMVEFAVKGNLFDAEGKSAAKIALDILSNYKNTIDKLYLENNSNIDEEFYNLTDKLQKNIQEVIDSRTKSEEKIFLSKWLAPVIAEIRNR